MTWKTTLLDLLCAGQKKQPIRKHRTGEPATAAHVRRRYRPMLEMLEERVLLAGLVSANVAPGIVGLGINGDSLSDEYAEVSDEEDFQYARNWVELLAGERLVPLGRTNEWGEPRRTQYEYNWARSGATSQSLLEAGQHTGLAAQIESGLVDYAVLAVGSNDFAPEVGSAYFNIYFDNWTPAQIQDYIATVVDNIETAIDTLAATDAHLVVGTLADYGVAPLTQFFYADAARREAVTNVIREVNQRITDYALARQIPVADLFAISKWYFGENDDPAASQTIGGVTFTNTAGVGATNAFVDNGIHLHTVPSAILANLFLEAFSLGYGSDFLRSQQFSEREIVDLAGGVYTADTLNLDYSQHVALPPVSPPQDSPFAGSYSGSFSGTVNAFGQTESIGGDLAFTIDSAGVLAMTQPGLGEGQVDASGTVSFTVTVMVDQLGPVDVEGSGTIVISQPGTAAANGNWTTSFTGGSGAGTWSAGGGVAVDTPWRNSNNPLDVNADGMVTPIDVLLIINHLNRSGSGPLPIPPASPDAPPPYLDVSGDNVVAPVDALLVINYLNALVAGASGEGEPWLAGEPSRQGLAEAADGESSTFAAPLEAVAGLASAHFRDAAAASLTVPQKFREHRPFAFDAGKDHLQWLELEAALSGIVEDIGSVWERSLPA